jgi:hypothetical protein
MVKKADWASGILCGYSFYIFFLERTFQNPERDTEPCFLEFLISKERRKMITSINQKRLKHLEKSTVSSKPFRGFE